MLTKPNQIYNPTLAQLVERLTVDVLRIVIKLSPVRFRQVGIFYLFNTYFKILIKPSHQDYYRDIQHQNPSVNSMNLTVYCAFRRMYRLIESLYYCHYCHYH